MITVSYGKKGRVRREGELFFVMGGQRRGCSDGTGEVDSTTLLDFYKPSAISRFFETAGHAGACIIATGCAIAQDEGTFGLEV